MQQRKNQTALAVDYYGDVFKATRSIGADECNSVPAGVAVLSGNKNFICFPNPSMNGHVTIAGFDAEQNKDINQVDIISSDGKLILSATVQQLPFDINTSVLSKGVYFLQMKGNDFNSTQKLIIE